MKRSSIILLLLCFITCVIFGKKVLAQQSGSYLTLSGVTLTNPPTFINSSDGGMTVKQGVPMYLGATWAEGSDVSMSPVIRCLWNMDFYQGSSTYETSLPGSGGACSASWGSITFTAPPGTYSYPLIDALTRGGATLAYVRILVTIEPAPSPSPTFTATPTPLGFPTPSSSPGVTPTPLGFPTPSSSPGVTPTPSGFPSPSSSPGVSPTPSASPNPSTSPNPGVNGTVEDIRYVSFSLTIDADPSKDPPPVVIQSQVQLRNLKTNL